MNDALPADPITPLLFRAPNWIGDAVMSLPALDALGRLRPDAPLTVATREPALAVFDGHPAVSARVALPAGGRAGDRAAVRALGAGGYGAALVLSPSFRSALQVWRAGIPRRIGFAGDMRRPLLTHVPGRRRGLPGAHQVRDYLDLAEYAGASAAEELPRIMPDLGASRRVEQVVGSLGNDPRSAVALAPFAAGNATKRWPADRFAQLGMALARRELRPVIVGGPQEGGAARAMARVIDAAAGRRACFVLAGRSTVPPVTLAALAPHLPCLVSNDTGPMHLWAAGGGHCVALFGSSLPGMHGPLGPGHRVIHRSLPCSGCYGRTCAHGLECMMAIQMDEVLGHVLERVGDVHD